MHPDDPLAAEFRRRPLGPYSPNLQRLLNAFRGAPAPGKHVLMCLEPHRRWALGRLSGRRGGGVVLEDVTFDDRARAEWEVFRRRWAASGRPPLEP